MVLGCNARFYWSKLCNCAMRHKFKMAVYRGKTHEKVKNVFGIPSLHAEQEEALRQFFSNHARRVCEPSDIVWKIPYFSSYTNHGSVLLRRIEGTHIAIVISPLKSLMEDQVRHLKNLNISAVSVTDEQNDRIIGEWRYY